MKRTGRLSVLLVLLLLALSLCACTGRAGEECGHENLNIVTEEISPPSCTAGGAYYEKGICTACGELIYLRKCESAPTGHRFNEYPYCIDCGFVRGSDGIEYARDGAAPRYVVVSGAGCTDEVIYIAEKIDGYPVEIIGTEAFSGNTRVTKIVIPKTVKSIGVNAFSDCTSLKSVNIPEGIAAIDDSAFSGCSSLEFTERDGVYYIGGDDNPYAYLSHIADKETLVCNIADGVRYISRAAFRGCVNIEKIVIPEGVGVIGDGTFSGLTSLRELSLPSTVYSVGKYATAGCKSLSLHSFGGAYYLGNEKNPTVALISIIDSSATSCEISPTAKRIHRSGFFLPANPFFSQPKSQR